MSTLEFDPLTGLRKKTKGVSGAQPYALFGGPSQYDGPGGGDPGIPPGYNPLAAARTTGRRSDGMPDYAGIINNDPTYQQAKLDFGALGISDAAQRAAATQRALTLFGEVPDFNGMGLNADWLNTDVTAQTRQLAKQNTVAGLSLSARRAKMFEDNIRGIKGALAARGALRSGESGHQLQGAQLGYDTAKFDATNELLEYISGLQAGFAERQRLGQRDLGTAATEAEARVRASHPGVAPSPGVPSAGWDVGNAAAKVRAAVTPPVPPVYDDAFMRALKQRHR